MSRQRYLVSYDIANDKRLRRVAKICEGYGSRLQFSVFECPLDDSRFEQLKADLAPVVNRDEDQVLFVCLGGEAAGASIRIEALGRPYTTRSRVTVL